MKSEWSKLNVMHARSALFDLYGDHLARREGWAPIAGVVRLLDALDIAAPAVRTAVSRMVREGWLRPVERGGSRGYAATESARAHLQGAHARIYATGTPSWDGSWDVVVLQPIPARSARDRVAAMLRYLGYAQLAGTTWVAPRRHEELAVRLHEADVDWHGFASRLDGDDRGLAARLWDLEDLARAYADFSRAVADGAYPGPVGAVDRVGAPEGSDRAAFARRTELVHRWRLFLFTDPGLPADVLPPNWPRPAAAAAFRSAVDALAPAADAYVDACFGPPRPATQPSAGSITGGRRRAG